LPVCQFDGLIGIRPRTPLSPSDIFRGSVGLESLIPDLVDILLSPARFVFIENVFALGLKRWHFSYSMEPVNSKAGKLI